MQKNKKRFYLRLLAALFFLLLLLFLLPFLRKGDPSPTEKAIQQKLLKEGVSYKKLSFDLLDPNQAPPAIKESVMLGYRILNDTGNAAKEYVGNRLSCTNCHFAAGNTTGGVNGSIPLAGIAAAYPEFNKKLGKVITLEERINSCFERSMNGKPLPLGSPEMIAITTYIHWISKNFPIYQPVPWRGLKGLHIQPNPDARRGAAVWKTSCASCHGMEGKGGSGIPPVWGEGSYNDGAGMHELSTLSAFIHANMPYENATLSEEESVDVAAYIREQPRPHYKTLLEHK